MKRRVDPTMTPPDKLTTYSPDPLTMTANQWEAGYAKWSRRRKEWAASRGLDPHDLPSVVGDSPFDVTLL